MASYSFREYVASISPPWLLGALSSGFVGVTLATVGDLLADGMRLALRMPWLLDEESPNDILPLIARERRLPGYPLETLAQYRARLFGAWEAYRFGGSAYAIESQLAAAGYPNAEVLFYPGRPGPNGESPYYSQFWVRFPIGSHEVLHVGKNWDAFSWDDGTPWGPVYIPPDFNALIHGIIRKWKPVQWICRGFIFEFSGVTWDSFNWNDGTAWTDTAEAAF
jgi:hypothetical protein